MTVVVLVSYANSFHAPFQFDDAPNITDNLSVHFNDFSLGNVKELIKENYSKSIRVFAYLTFALNYYFGGLDVFGYHLVNVLIHLCTGILVYWFLFLTFSLPSLRERYGSRAFPFALFSSLLFLSHPIQTQSVTYIVQRMASMAGMFYLLGLVLYLKGRLYTGIKRYLCWVGLVLVYPLGVFTKENVAILPLFIGLYEFYFFQNLKLTPEGKKTIAYGGGAVLLIGLLIFLIWGERYYDVMFEGYKIRDFTMTERVLTQFRVVLYYLTLIVYPSPSRLNLDYDFPISKGLLDPWTTLPSILIVGGVVGYGIWTAKKRPLLSYFVLWYFGNLVIESSVFPLEIVYEHRLYLPIVGSVVLFVVGVVRGWELLRKKLKAREGGEGKKWPLWTFFLCLTLLFSVCSYKRNLIWRDEITLWQDAAAKSPSKPRTLYNLALAFSRIGRYKEAIGLLTRAISLKPNYVEAYNNLGAALADSGRPDEAVPVLEKAISIKPDHPEAYFNLGNVYLAQQGKVNAAISFFTKAIMLKPDYVDAYINLAAGYNRLGRFDETVHLLERVEGMIARRADGRFNLGVAYAGLGNTNAARRELKMVRQVDPRMAQQLENFMRQVRDK